MKSFPNQLIHSYSWLFYFAFPSTLATGSMKKNTQEKFFSLPTLTIFSSFQIQASTSGSERLTIIESSASVHQHDAGR